jgi:hypothetical protein
MTRAGWISVGVLVIAVWVLGAHTIGEAVGGRQSELVGLAVALLAGLAAYHLPSVRVPEPPAGRLAAWLVGGGVACVLGGLALQFYLAAQASDHARRAADVAEQAARGGQRVPDVNVRATYPGSVGAVGYGCVLAGVGAVVCGVRVGVSAGWPGPAAEPGGAPDTGRRMG